MRNCKPSITVLLLGAFFIIASNVHADLQHFEPVARTLNSMTFLIQEATLDDEDLVVDDEVGVFTPDGLCVGAIWVEEEGASLGFPAWPDDDRDDEEITGFYPGEDITFMVWDNEADQEWEVFEEDIEIVNDVEELEFQENGFLVCRIAAYRIEGPDIETDPAHEGEIDFGNVWEDGEDDTGTDTLTIYSTGFETLVVGSITVEGDEFSTDFGDQAVDIEPGDSIEVIVTFAPGGVGQYGGSLTIDHNVDLNDNNEDDEGDNIVISLVGELREPAPWGRLSAYDYDFADTQVDDERAWQIFVYSDGEAALVINNLVIEGDDAFTTNFEEEITLEPEERYMFEVVFAPGAEGEFAADLQVSCNAENEEDLVCHLTGTGVAEFDPPEITAPAQHFFSVIEVNDTEHWRMVILNTGGSDLWIYGVECEEEVFANDFAVDSARLRPDDHYNVDVTFTPDEEAIIDGELHIYCNDPNLEDGYAIVYVRGVGVDEWEGGHYRFYTTDQNHNLLVVEATFNDEALEPGDEIAVFTQDGFCAGAGIVPDDDDRRVGFAAFGDANPDDEIIDGFVADEEFSFKVWQSATGREARGEPQFEQGPEVFRNFGVTVLNLDADTVPMPDIELSANFYPFGQVDYDDEQVEDWTTFRISNVGDAVLEVSSIDSDTRQFSVLDFEGADIQPDNDLQVIIRFAPDAEEHYVGRLTINSNDPVDPVLYVDVDGYGVTDVEEPEIRFGDDPELPVEGHFFGVQHCNEGNWEGGPYDYTLTIHNYAGGVLIIENIQYEGDGAFNIDWNERQIQIEAGQSTELTISFNPDEVRRYDGTYTFIWNNPIENDITTFEIQGYGSDAEDYFLHHETEGFHDITVDRAFIWLEVEDDDNLEADLGAGDEIAVFDGNLCVGHTILDGDGIVVRAWAAEDLNAAVINGFVPAHEMSFRFWDWTREEELDNVVVEFNAGDEAFDTDGGSNVTLSAEIGEMEQQVGYDIIPDNGDEEDPDHWEWGTVHVDNAVEHTIVIYNSGGHTLVVTGVETNNEVLDTDFGDEDIEMETGEGFELTVTFTPVEDFAYSEAQVIITSNDPDEPEFGIYMTGSGSIEEGHFDFYNSGANNSILIRSFTMGGAPSGAGDEVAVYLPVGFWPTVPGFCAGTNIVVDPGAQLNVAAWGDETRSRYLKEGFSNNQDIVFRVWDASQEQEYLMDDIDIDMEQGRLTWTLDALTVIRTLNVPGVFSLVYDPVPVEDVVEGETVEFSLVINNPPVENMELEFLNPEVLEDLGDFNLSDEGEFTWDTDPYESGQDDPYELHFRAFDPEDEETQDDVWVSVMVLNINHAPVFNDDSEDGYLVDNALWEWIADEEIWAAHIDEDTEDWVVYIEDLSAFCSDPDNDTLEIWEENPEPADRIDQLIDRDAGTYSLKTISANWFGQVSCGITAWDRVNDRRDNYTRTLRMIRDVNRDTENVRSLRHIAQTPSAGPRRDLETTFEFLVIVDPVNDPPEIVDPPESWRFTEGEEGSFNLQAQDLEDPPEDLVWEMIDNGGLPGGPEFVDNGNGTATFTWTPTFDDAGEYNPIFQVEDTDGGTAVDTVTITVEDVNRTPVFSEAYANGIPNQQIDEDSGLTVIVDLDEVFLDPDGDAMAFEITAQGEHLNAVLDGDNVLYVNTDQDWHGDEDITVTASDAEFSLESTFTVMVVSVNDPPGAFNLIEPEDNYRFEDGMRTVSFSWTAPEEVAFEVDTILYAAVFKVVGNDEDSLVIPGLDATEYPDVDVYAMMDQLGLEPDDQHQVLADIEWYVIALDQLMAATRSDSVFHVNIVLAVSDQYGSAIPDDYFLAPNFPNPFNAKTTIRFGLPVPNNVDVTVWDMHGRRVAELVSGYYSAGRFEVVWEAGHIPTGVYIIRFVSGNRSIMQKSILLK